MKAKETEELTEEVEVVEEVDEEQQIQDEVFNAIFTYDVVLTPPLA